MPHIGPEKIEISQYNNDFDNNDNVLKDGNMKYLSNYVQPTKTG